jgi:hypothetical protein
MFIMHDIAYFVMQIKSPLEMLCEDLLEDPWVRKISFWDQGIREFARWD